MHTILVDDGSEVPAGLRALIERGSTSLVEHRAAELRASPRPAAPLGADRIVFWSTSRNDDVQALAERVAAAESAERREAIVFVTAEGGAVPPGGLSPHEVFTWPRDEDRLKMAFLTGG